METSSITSKTKIPLVWAVSILLSLSSAIGTAAVAHYRLTQLEEKWSEFKTDHETHVKVETAHDLRIQAVELGLANISRTLDRIEVKLDRFGERDDKRGR